VLVGYMRISTVEQNLALQRDALLAAGVAPDRMYEDTCSGTVADRPGLARALDVLRPGDALVVWKLDRIGRSLAHVVELVGALQAKGIGLKVLTGGIDTTSATGRLVFGIFATLSEFERDLIHERTVAGLAAARARGRTGGRPRLRGCPKRVERAQHDGRRAGRGRGESRPCRLRPFARTEPWATDAGFSDTLYSATFG
jgi:DNA invertase Pin-like site-specific DNA recombinase